MIYEADTTASTLFNILSTCSSGRVRRFPAAQAGTTGDPVKLFFFTRPVPISTKDIALAIGLAIVLLFACGLAAAVPVAVYAGSRQPEQEYYRALYDTCVVQTGYRELCLRSIANFRREYRWYEQESPGWEWPLPDEVPAPARSP